MLSTRRRHVPLQQACKVADTLRSIDALLDGEPPHEVEPICSDAGIGTRSAPSSAHLAADASCASLDGTLSQLLAADELMASATASSAASGNRISYSDPGVGADEYAWQEVPRHVLI